MKKKLIFMFAIMILSIAGVTFAHTGIRAEEMTENPGVKIDREQFPCDLIREEVAQLYDKNNDGFLSDEEIHAVTFWCTDALGMWEEWQITHQPEGLTKEEEYKRYGVIDCKGLEIFKNLKGVSIIMTSAGGHQSRLKNLDSLSKLRKLEKLEIEYSCNIKHYDFSKFKNLRELSLIDCWRVKTITFGKKSKIEKLDLSGTKGNGNIDVSGLRHLKKFKAKFTRLKKITFGKRNKKLTNIHIGGDPSARNKKIKSLDFSKVKNLKKLEIHSLDGLEKIIFGNVKVNTDWIYNCKKLGV